MWRLFLRCAAAIPNGNEPGMGFLVTRILSQPTRMSDVLSPSAALSPEAFYSLYLGGLIIEDETERLEASYTLLMLGRLGLTPAELLHLHEGWVDWERGEIHVPARDPCACDVCWEHARQRQRAGDTRNPETIVIEECWTPGKSGARRLAFGWSRRLTAAIDGVLDAGTHLERDRETVREHVETAAAMAHHVDTTEVSITALRASALTFLASAGFGPRRLADVTATDEETAGEFARVGGGETRSHLYRVLADVEPPTLCEGETRYRLVCDPTALQREPFDPTEYDAEWRRERATRSVQRDRNPRPASPPSEETSDEVRASRSPPPGVSFTPADLPSVQEPAGQHGPGLVAESLAEWVEKQEQERHASTGDGADPATQHGDYRPGEAEQEEDDNPLQVTEPVAFSVDTRLVAPRFEGGRPTGGSILLGQDELLFLSRGASGIADYLRVDLDWIVNLAPGYVPDPLEGLLEDTVAIAYHNESGDRRVVVAEIPADSQWTFVQTIFAVRLDSEPAVVTHRPGTAAAIGPHEREMDATRDRLWLEQTDTDRSPVRLRLEQFVDVEQGPMTAEEGYEKGLIVTHLHPSGDLVDMELRPTAESNVHILREYLTHFDERQTRRARNAQLSQEETDILERLYDAEGGRDLAGMLDKDRETLSTVMERLDDLGLVRDGSGGKRLTGVGYRLVSPKFDL